MKSIKLFFYRFVVIKNDKAKKLGLKFTKNIYGDAINIFNCRSLWTDKKGRIYRVENLV